MELVAAAAATAAADAARVVAAQLERDAASAADDVASRLLAEQAGPGQPSAAPRATGPSARHQALRDAAPAREDGADAATIRDLDRQGASSHTIAAALNSGGSRTALHARWTFLSVRRMLHLFTLPPETLPAGSGIDPGLGGADRATAVLRRAIRNGEMVLHYQPKVDLREGGCRRVEALVRWDSPDRGLVFPDSFIPLAEASGLIHDLTTWVVREAVRQARAWQDQGLYLTIAVNIAAQSLQGGAALEIIRTALEEQQVSPFSLEIELTESGVMGDPVVALEVLEQFNRLGVKVAIDDFGTGFSSLLYLRDLPLHTLKIDKSFVMDMLTTERNPAIVASTIALGHALGLRVVAEGVEDAETAAALLELGCDEGQGYFWTKALPPGPFERWVAEFGSQPVPRGAGGAVTNDVHALRAYRRLIAGTDADALSGVLVDYVHAVGGAVADADDDVVGLMQLDLTLGLAPAVLPVAVAGTMARQQLEANLPLLLSAARLVLTRSAATR